MRVVVQDGYPLRRKVLRVDGGLPPVFFFQAEDGIRDGRVTGVQTCALPIFGGKAPMVVLSDADLDEAAAAASFGAFMNSGQICMSTERIVADVSVAGQLASKLSERAQALTTGDPRDEGTMVGPLVDDAGREHVLELLADARAMGATVLTG